MGIFNEELEVLLRESSWLNIGQVESKQKKLEGDFVVYHTLQCLLGSPNKAVEAKGWSMVSSDGTNSVCELLSLEGRQVLKIQISKPRGKN